MPSTLAPGGHFGFQHETEPVAFLLPQYRAGCAAVYVYGRIAYSDVFSDDWFTTCRLVCYGQRIAKGDGTFDLCREGNESS